MRRTLPLLVSLATFAAVAPAAHADAKSVDYGRDVKPILAGRCYACHGPDAAKRKANLRLDVRESAVQIAIEPGKPDESVLFDRVTSKDTDFVMPPPETKLNRLTPAEVETLRRWVAQGAKYDLHWAYVKPTRPTPPVDAGKGWARTPIDRFVAAEHARRGYRPAPEADRRTLIRRLSFDLLGLPPAPDEVEAFVADKSPDAYEKLVDRLLASPHYGERMALYWLDLVRYADTIGYHSDTHRDIALYRDYVIRAFNANKRFDRFTTEQLAGDLLPHATDETRVASGYNRLLMTTEEGGAQAKEYVAKYSADRVRNVSAVWLAGTMGCCECHDHKFDPYRTRDFYRLAAFFADIKETAVGKQTETPLPTPEQAAQLKRLDEQSAALRTSLAKPTPAIEAARAEWEKRAKADLEAKKPARGLPAPVVQALTTDPAKRTPAQKEALAAYHRGIAPELASLREQIQKVEAERDQLKRSVPLTLVSMSVSPRVMRVLPRGNWLDDSGEVVAPGVPAFLAGSAEPDAKKRATRLDLARWMTASDNPLVARVFVNRLWKLGFGQGIVKSVEDFGTQGVPPTHPQLLDWLATEFVASGWDVKHTLKQIVTSATYRQSSVASRGLRERDPSNQWLARQGRFRLDAETVRDNALAVSGLLVRKIGGPSVKPYQPPGYWSYLNFPKREYRNDKGEGLYRRGLYTYWCRTFPHPSLSAFDAPSREECTADRPRSSTPLQALVLLNDPIYVEAARVFAGRVVAEGGRSPADRLGWAYRRALARLPKADELKLLTALYEKHRREYASDQEAARKLLGIGDAPLPKDADATELAAWASVARVLLNLHETITRE